MSLRIKVCGMKYPDNIKSLSVLEPDFMGFIFYPPSKRFIGLDFQRDDISSIPSAIQKTAVFVNAELHEVIEFSNLYGMKTVQLHGDESPDFCNSLKEKGFSVIKAFGVSSGFEFNELEVYLSSVHFFLFDTKTDEHGGSGKTFDWEILNSYKFEKPFFLSGGLSLDNISSVKKIENKYFYGVDLNSKFEIEPAIKDMEKLAKAFELIKD